MYSVLYHIFTVWFAVLVATSAGSHIRSLMTEERQPPVSQKQISADYISRYWHSLVVFAAEHEQELLDARAYRKWECGSIVSASSTDCEICFLIVYVLRSLVELGSTQDDIAKFFTDVCSLLKFASDRICNEAVQSFKRELFGTLKGVTMKTKEICGYVLGSDCGAPYNPEAMWNVTFPDMPKPPITPPQPPKPGSPTLRVLHLTDFHWDHEYSEGANAVCGEPLCCRKDDGPPAPGVAGAGRYGDFRNCDSSKPMLDNLFSTLRSMKDQFDYVLFTGDIPSHNFWTQSRDDQVSAMDKFTEYMRTYLPDKKVFSTLGNHESAPVNSFPPEYIHGNNSISWLYEAAADNWRHWLPPDTRRSIRKGGFYSVSPFPGLRVISLNMNMCNNGNWWLYINATDPNGMLQWFIDELQEAEDMGQKAHVIGHIFPGCTCCLKPFSWNYYRIVNRYENTIVEQFFGHVHSMGYEVMYDEDTLTRPLGVVYMPGSITTFSYLNPGFRIYQIDGNYTGSSWRVQDYTNYFLNLTSANMYSNPVWQKEYSAKEAYGLISLFPKDWNDLIYRMKTDDALFDTFCSHMAKSAPNKCDRKSTLCSLKTGRNGDPHLCKDL